MLAGFFAGMWWTGARSTTRVNAGSMTAGQTSARAMCTMDVATGRVLFAHNADQSMGMASTTKVVTALTVLENCQDLDTKVRVADEAIGIDCGCGYADGRLCCLRLDDMTVFYSEE